MAPTPTAIITGGGSGIGFAVAEFLVQKRWRVLIVDVVESRCEQAAQKLGCSCATADISDYDQQVQVFEKAWKEFGKLDFVFANAGLTDTFPFYKPVAAYPPPRPDLKAGDVNFTGTIYTCYLAMQYFRRNPAGSSGTLIATSSGAGVYSAPPIPVYAAAKHAVVGLVRAIAPVLAKEGIFVHAILPGAVATNVVDPKSMEGFGDTIYTPVGDIVNAVDALLLGEFAKAGITGRIIEVSRGSLHHRDQPAYCDETMASVMQLLAVADEIKSTNTGDAVSGIKL
ncbi:hypothetical protein AJ80_04203 [Polytolypa hystricis UAMH7299]|uniref:Uncharacterized protein n=1 Tax=Polytolypa hystricis (strain UAMH7299) TaxID=1447883 RepID=A0A2B7YCY1_POLH7|nr:hypothetical protein AJ80_04203 [Polytolypa hystricis UAMH7299]